MPTTIKSMTAPPNNSSSNIPQAARKRIQFHCRGGRPHPVALKMAHKILLVQQIEAAKAQEAAAACVKQQGSVTSNTTGGDDCDGTSNHHANDKDDDEGGGGSGLAMASGSRKQFEIMRSSRRRIRFLDRFGVLVAILYILTAILPECDAFVTKHIYMGRMTATNQVIAPHHHSRTNLAAFLWFGGDEEEEDNEKQSDTSSTENQAVTSGLSSVAQVMERMGQFKASQRVGEKTAQILQELQEKEVVEGMAANGNIRVTCNGQQQPISVQIDEAYLQELVEDNGGEAAQELSAALLMAMTDAHAKSASKIHDKLKNVYTELGFDNN